MQKLKNNEARPKFTGYYKKKACTPKIVRASMPVKRKILIHSLLKFLFLSLYQSHSFSIGSPDLQYLLNLTCSFHFWNLQSFT